LKNDLRGGIMTRMGKTATEASKEIGCSIATVSRWVKRLQLGEKYGSSFVLLPKEIKLIAKEWRKSSGRPKTKAKKIA
jgi:uncharacterized protein YerC